MSDWNYETILARAKEQGVRYRGYLVLSPERDPFYVGGTPKSKMWAYWFADLWDRFGFTTDVHIRRVHYRIVHTKEPTIRPDGKPYLNTVEDWNLLCGASVWARTLGLVDPNAFVDRRNAQPSINSRVDEPFVRVPEAEVEAISWYLPSVDRHIYIYNPDAEVDGYEPHDSDQPYLLELWIEKSTMREELLPICKRFNINYLEAKGTQSITNAILLLQRAAEAKKPVRVFYISDFDPAGNHMPVVVSRHLQYWKEKYAPDADVRLMPLALTHEQVSDLDIPRTMLKASDKRRDLFEEKYGVGGVELDALAEIYPGMLEEIVTTAVEPYYDTDIEGELEDAKEEAQRQAQEEVERLMAPHDERREDIRQRAEAVKEKYAETLAAFEAEIQPLTEELSEIEEQAAADLEAFEPELPERPVSELEVYEDDDEWMFDSERDYLDQTKILQSCSPKKDKLDE